MSSENTRDRILDSALRLIRKRGDAGVTMAHIAKAAGISRQAVYLHFADRAQLLIAAAQHADHQRGLADEIRKVADSPTAIHALRAMATLQARTNPAIWAIARAVDAVRRSDPAAEAAWQDRFAHRLEGAREIIQRLAREKKLRPGLDPQTAADLLWTLTSLRAWEDLVLERRWTADEYEQRMADLLVRIFTR